MEIRQTSIVCLIILMNESYCKDELRPLNKYF